MGPVGSQWKRHTLGQRFQHKRYTSKDSKMAMLKKQDLECAALFLLLEWADRKRRFTVVQLFLEEEEEEDSINNAFNSPH